MKIIKRLTTILIIMSVMVGGSSTVFASNSSAQTIQEAKDYNAQKKLKIYESSAFFKTDYIKMEIINNEMVRVKGRIDVEKTNWLFKIDHVDKGNKLNIIKEVNEIKSNRTYENTFVLRNKLKEGEYKISIYFEENHDSMYWSYYRDISLNYEAGDIFFPVSPVYENNCSEFMKNSVIEPKNYLNVAIKNESERKQIEDLANKITKDAKSDYEKILKINDWVAQNIYYNWDDYTTGTYGRTDAYGTLESRKSVCQGYAELTDALLRAAGIPSRLVTGYALGADASGGSWNDVNHTQPNHAWNEAFVDNRWIILDTAWNSGNRYENETFKEGTMNYRYFDPSLEVFSYTHKIIDIR